jgi:hypothetical protein
MIDDVYLKKWADWLGLTPADLGERWEAFKLATLTKERRESRGTLALRVEESNFRVFVGKLKQAMKGN